MRLLYLTGRRSFFPQLLVFILFCVRFAGLLCVSAEPSAADAPTIDPPSNTFVGEVAVSIKPRYASSITYFTVNGLEPSDRDDVFLQGTELVFDEPGHYVVQAVSYFKKSANEFTPSKAAVMFYNVTPAALTRPVAEPSSNSFGRYFHSPVSLRLSHDLSLQERLGDLIKNVGIRYVVTYVPTLSTDGTSGALPPLAPNAVWSAYNGQSIVLKEPGTYILRLQAHETILSAPLQSPQLRLVYRVRPPLVYDVSTDSGKDSRQPVVGRPFTVWLSHAVRPAAIFLSTSAKGCERQRRMLEDTSLRDIGERQRAFQFVTCAEDQPRVYVCLREKGDETYRMVQRRGAALKDTSAHAFSVIAAEDGAIPSDGNCTVFNRVVHHNKPISKVEDNGGLWLFVLFIVICAFFLALTMYIRFFSWRSAKLGSKSRGRTLVE